MFRSITLVTMCLLLQASAAFATTVAYYRFEEGTAGNGATGIGTVIDGAANPDNATGYNSPLYVANVPVNPIPQTGASNQLALSFNGDQAVLIPDASKFYLTQSLTVEAYIYETGAPNNSLNQSQIVFRGDDRGGYDPFSLAAEGNGTTIWFSIDNAADGNATVTATIPLDQWVDLAGTLNNSTGVLSLYVNGKLQDSMVTPIRSFGQLQSDQDPGLGIGGLQDPNYAGAGGLGGGNSQYFNGLIDEVRISDQALTPSQFLDAQASVPEPMSLGLIGMGACTMLLRRSHRD